MNKVYLIGNLVKDPELITTSNGKKVCKFSIAVQRKRKDADGEYPTDFFTCLTFKTTAENVKKYLKKGKKAAVIGEIQNHTYDDSEGVKHYSTEIVCNEVEFLSPVEKQKDNVESQPDTPATSEAEDKSQLEPVDDDSLPF